MCIILFEITQIFPLRLHKKVVYSPVFLPVSYTSVNSQKFIYLFVMNYYALFAYNEGNERNAHPFTCGVYRVSERFTCRDVQGLSLKVAFVGLM